MEAKKQQYVLLQGLKAGNRFFTTNIPNEDPTKLSNGTIAYKILGYADSVNEAQIKLYGKIF